MKFLSSLVLFFILSYSSYGQVTNSPKVGKKAHTYIHVNKVEITDNHTVIDFTFENTSGFESVFTGYDHYIVGADGDKKKLLKTDGIPISPKEEKLIIKNGATLNYTIYFEKLAPGNELINIIEGTGSYDFNFYDVEINNPEYPIQQEVKEEVIIDTKSINLNIQFAHGSPKLKWQDREVLDTLALAMKQNPNMEIELEGHTEKDEDDYTEYQRMVNLKLSEHRLLNVKRHLVSRGIASKRIKTKAYGGTEPISDDNAANRRVVMNILKE